MPHSDPSAEHIICIESTITRHAYNQQFQNEFLDFIFKGEPQNMFTNIENGYGIFAGYCESTFQIIQNE